MPARALVDGARALTLSALAANLGGLAYVGVPGWTLANALPPLRRLRPLHRLGYAYVLGVAAVGALLLALSLMIHLPLRRPALLVVVLVPIAVAVTVRRAQRDRVAPRPPSPRSGHRRSLVTAGLLIAAICVGPFASAITLPLSDWDGRAFWCVNAAYMRAEGTAQPSALTDERWFVLHPQYPPLMALVQAAVQEIFGAGDDQQFFRALYPAFFVALLLILGDGARRVAGRLPAAVVTLCLAAPRFVSYGGGAAASANNDLAIGAFYGATLVMLLMEPTTVAAGLSAGCMLAGLVLIKNEGTVLAIAALSIAASRLWKHRSQRSLAGAKLRWFLAAALPAASAAILLTAWRLRIPNRNDERYFANLDLAALVRSGWSRLLPTAAEITRLTFDWFEWHGLWVLACLVLLLGHQALRRPHPRLLLVAATVPLGCGLLAYSVTTHYPDLIAETWERLLLQAYVPLGIAIACALGRLLRDGELLGGARNAGGRAGDPGSGNLAAPPVGSDGAAG